MVSDYNEPVWSLCKSNNPFFYITSGLPPYVTARQIVQGNMPSSFDDLASTHSPDVCNVYFYMKVIGICV